MVSPKRGGAPGPPTEEFPPPAARRPTIGAVASPRRPALATTGAATVVLSVGLAAATVLVHGIDVDAVAWVAAQLVLVLVATVDHATRRIPNAVTVPAAALAVVARSLFEPGSLAETLVAGGACFAVFFVLALVGRGALGMGDVKLVGMLGLLLGRAVVPALVVGTIGGAVAAAAIALRTRTGRDATIAYGPYLCLGAAVAILAFDPPSLI